MHAQILPHFMSMTDLVKIVLFYLFLFHQLQILLRLRYSTCSSSVIASKLTSASSVSMDKDRAFCNMASSSAMPPGKKFVLIIIQADRSK